MTEIIGWASSVILFLTISKQIHKQWQEGTSEGVSKWLFIGQMTASLGFTIYSWRVGNWIFVITNGLMLVSALLGLGLVLHQRRNANRSLEDLLSDNLLCGLELALTWVLRRGFLLSALKTSRCSEGKHHCIPRMQLNAKAFCLRRKHQGELWET